MFQHFENSDDIEGTLRQACVASITRQDLKPTDSTILHCLQVLQAPCVAFHGGYPQFGKRVQQRPKKDAPAAADVKQACGVQATQDANHSAHPRQVAGPLESLQFETLGLAKGDEICRNNSFRRIGTCAADVGLGQFEIQVTSHHTSRSGCVCCWLATTIGGFAINLQYIAVVRLPRKLFSTLNVCSIASPLELNPPVNKQFQIVTPLAGLLLGATKNQAPSKELSEKEIVEHSRAVLFGSPKQSDPALAALEMRRKADVLPAQALPLPSRGEATGQTANPR